MDGELQAPTEDLIALRKQMANKVKQELLPALGVANWGVEESSVPVNPEAYHLYMQNAAIPRDEGAE